uniref:TAFA chemokine like family member 5 n=1 Tax=Scleropages formosus TaxID=113540 RepID=A0A8C9S806_SCLFO
MRGTRPRCVQVARRHSLGHGDTRRLLFRVLSAAGRDRRLSMAPRAGRTEGGDAGGRPTTTTMSATLWAALVLAVLLIACCSQLAAGTCEIVTLDRDSSQPRRTVARQTARCACRKGQIAGTTRARPACVDARIVRTKQWCEMMPCLDNEGCNLLVNKSGWTCTQPGGRVKTTTVS